MTTFGQLMLTISDRTLTFNMVCIKKMLNVSEVDIFVHPVKRVIAVRKAIENSRNSVQW